MMSSVDGKESLETVRIRAKYGLRNGILGGKIILESGDLGSPICLA